MPDINFVTRITGEGQVITGLETINKGIDQFGRTAAESSLKTEQAFKEMGVVGKQAAAQIEAGFMTTDQVLQHQQHALTQYTALLRQAGLTEKEAAEQSALFSKMAMKAQTEEYMALESVVAAQKQRALVAAEAGAAEVASAAKGAVAVNNVKIAIFQTQAAASGATGQFAAMGAGALAFGRSMQSALYPLRMIAYILPGIGIAGLVALTAEWLAAIVPIPDALKKVFESEEDVRRKAQEIRREVEGIGDAWDKSFSKIEEFGRKGELIGLTGIPKSRAELGQLAGDVDRAKEAFTSLSGLYNQLYMQAQQYRNVNGVRELTDEAKEALIRLGGLTKESQDALLSSFSKDRQSQILTGITDVSEKLAEAERKWQELKAQYALGVKELADATAKAKRPFDALAKTIEQESAIFGEKATIRNHAAEILKASAAQVTMIGNVDKAAAGLSDYQVHLLDAALSMKTGAIAAEGYGDAFASAAERVNVLGMSVDAFKEKQDDLFRDLQEFQGRPLFPQIPEPTTAELLKPGLLVPESEAWGNQSGKEFKSGFLQEISTIWTDFSRSFVQDIKSGNLAKAIGDFGDALLRTLIEGVLNPFAKALSSIMGNIMSAVIKGFSGGGWNFGNVFKGAGDIVKAGLGIGGAAALSGTALASTALPAGVATGVGSASYMASIGATPMLNGVPVAASSGGFASSMGAFLTNPYTIAAAAAAALGYIGYNLAKGPNSYQAGSKEAMRDFGGVSVGTGGLSQIWSALGVSESQAWPIRKDLLSSPQVLINVLWPLAQAQGRVNEFLGSLEHVETAWGDFDFRAAFELGTATGDWTDLNAQFRAAFTNSAALKDALPNWEALLTVPVTEAAAALGKMIKDLQAFKTALQESISPAETMFDIFLKTGEITKDLRDAVLKLGGDLAVFERYSNLMGQRTALQGKYDFQTSLASALQGQLPDPIQQLLSGNMGPDTIAALAGAKLDPARFTDLSRLGGIVNNWNYKPFQSLTPDLEYALKTYGGSEGMRAIENYQKGQNTITQHLLDMTLGNAQQAYQTAVKDALAYIGTVQKDTLDQMTTIGQLLDDIKLELMGQTDIMLGTATNPAGTGKALMYNQDYAAWLQQRESVPYYDLEEWTRLNPPPPEYIPEAHTGGLILAGQAGEAVLDREQTRNLLRGQGQAVAVNVSIDMRNARVSNAQEFVREVTQGLTAYFNGGGTLRMLNAR